MKLYEDFLDEDKAAQEMYGDNTFEEAVSLFTRALEYIGYPVQDQVHFTNTPRRFLKALVAMNTPQSFNFTTFDTEEQKDNGLVLVRNIPVASLCAHHLFPWHGVAHVAYIPRSGGKLAGLSKLARTLTKCAVGPTVQEEVGSATADMLMSELDPLGAAVIIKASHTCMSLRGAKAHGSETVTSTLRGVFFELPQARQELYQLLTI